MKKSSRILALLCVIFAVSTPLVAENLLDIVDEAEAAIRQRYPNESSLARKKALQELESIIDSDNTDERKIEIVRSKYLGNDKTEAQWQAQIRNEIDSWYQHPDMLGFDMSDADLMAADQYGYQTYGNRWVPFHRELYNRNEQMRSAEQANMAEWHKALSSFVQQNKGQQPTPEQRAQLMAAFNKIHGNQAAERAFVYANVMATRGKMKDKTTMGDLQAGKFPVSNPAQNCRCHERYNKMKGTF